jgi:hypothetical protein
MNAALEKEKNLSVEREETTTKLEYVLILLIIILLLRFIAYQDKNLTRKTMVRSAYSSTLYSSDSIDVN